VITLDEQEICRARLRMDDGEWTEFGRAIRVIAKAKVRLATHERPQDRYGQPSAEGGAKC
jgi:hypothetical protein